MVVLAGGNHPIVLLCAYRTDEDLAQHLLTANSTPSATTPSSTMAASITRDLVEEAASRPAAAQDDHSGRVQRALERRRQRLQAKVHPCSLQFACVLSPEI